jgi:hypothetical protein
MRPSWTRAFGMRRAAFASEAAGGAGALSLPVRVGPRARPWWLSKPLGAVGGAIVLVMLAAAVLADWVAPYGFAQTSLRERFIVASAAHWLC